MSRFRALAALVLLITLMGCGGQGNPVLQTPGSPATGAKSTPTQPGAVEITPAPGAEGGNAVLIPPKPTTGLPLPPAPQALGSGSGDSAPAAQVNLGAFSLGELPETVPPQPANRDAVQAKLAARHASSTKSASDANLFALTPFSPMTLTALGQFAPPLGGNAYAFLSSDDPGTPALETFNAQHLSAGNTELHVWGAVTASNVRDMIYAQIGLVTDYTYNYAMDPNQDGNPADAIPQYMFNQNVSMMNAVAAGTPFCAPLDFNGNLGLGLGRGYAPGNGYDFDLRLVPNQAPGGTGGLCWLRVRPRSAPYQPWSVYSGQVANPALGQPYGTDNWGWRPPEDFSNALLLAQIYSYNATGVPGTITFQYVRETEGPLSVPTVDCRALTNARFLLAGPGADGLQGTGDDVALTGWNSTNAAINAEPALLLGDKFYVFFDNDPAQVNDIELYPSTPVAGMVQYTTTGLVADPALAAYFDLPDAVPGLPGMVYAAAHPFTLLLRNGAYNRIENDVRSLTWANFQLATNPGFLAITPVRPTAGSNVDRVILAQGVQYTPFYYGLAYTQAGSYPPPGGFGAQETIYPNAHTTGFISVGYNALTEGGTVLGNYYDQAGLVNTLQADAYCRFETRTMWGPTPQYGMADTDLLGWISLPTLDPRSQPWNTAVYARGTNFILQTTDASVSPVVNVAAGRLLDAGLGAGAVVNFNTVGGAGPYAGSFNVLPVRVYDDPAQSDPANNVARVAGIPPQWDVVVNFLLQYGQAPYTVELDSDYDGAWNSAPAGRVYQIDGDTVTPGIQTFAVGGAAYSRTVRIPNTHPAGGFNFAIRVTDALGAQYTYAWANTVWLPGAPQIDARTLTSARFSLHNPGGVVLINNRDTDVVYDATAQVALGASYYVDFQLDAAASPNDRALYPARPSVAGVVQYTAQGLVIDPALTPYFDTTDNGYTLHLRPGAYNRITNNVTSLSWANYSLIEDGTGTTIMAARATNTSNTDNVVLRANVNYRPRFASLPYATTGSSLRAETIYPVEWNTGYITTGFGSLAEGGTVLGNYFDQAGLVNTLQADAFCRFESDTSAGVNYGFNDVGTGLPIVAAVLDPLARPYDVQVFARGTVFDGVDAAANTTANVTVGAGRVLNGVTTLNLPLGARNLNLNVLPVRVFDNPALTDPYQNVTQVAGGWNVVLNFLLQYGQGPYTVELDGDWGGAWNDGTAGRIYAVPGSPFAAVGAQTSTVNIPSASQPGGSYTFAIRVTDALGAQYTYVWPDLVTLNGWVLANPNPASTGNVGQYASMALVNGAPAIAYYDVTNTNLMYVRAANALGTTWNAPVTVDNAGNTGQWISLKVVNGNPAISYYRATNSELRYVRAADINGAAWGAPMALDSAGTVGQYTSLAVVNGDPAISYYDATNTNLKYIRSTDVNGVAWAAAVVVDGAASATGSYTSLAVVNGDPAISYYSTTNLGLMYIRATDANGAVWGAAAVNIDGGLANRGTWSSLLVVNGNPAITYRYLTPNQIRYVRASDANGGAWNVPIVIDAASTPANFGTSLAIIQGNPAVAYYRTTGGDLYYRRASDASGTAWFAAVAADTTNNIGRYPSLLEIGGQPAIAYYDVTNADLKYVRYYP